MKYDCVWLFKTKRIWNEYQKKFHLSDIKFKWLAIEYNFGRYMFRKQTIIINPYITLHKNEEFIRDIILHEIAHHIHFKTYSTTQNYSDDYPQWHGKAWIKIARDIGFKGPVFVDPRSMYQAYKIEVKESMRRLPRR